MEGARVAVCGDGLPSLPLTCVVVSVGFEGARVAVCGDGLPSLALTCVVGGGGSEGARVAVSGECPTPRTLIPCSPDGFSRDPLLLLGESVCVSVATPSCSRTMGVRCDRDSKATEERGLAEVVKGGADTDTSPRETETTGGGGDSSTPSNAYPCPCPCCCCVGVERMRAPLPLFPPALCASRTPAPATLGVVAGVGVGDDFCVVAGGSGVERLPTHLVYACLSNDGLRLIPSSTLAVLVVVVLVFTSAGGTPTTEPLGGSVWTEWGAGVVRACVCARVCAPLVSASQRAVGCAGDARTVPLGDPM